MENSKLEIATFAGGCFWCISAAFELINGVKEIVSGYSGGKEKNPTYEQVCSGKTGHRESVQIKFDPNIITYRQLLEIFLRNIDPTDDGGQFADRGEEYKTAIFYHNQEQKKLAEKAIDELSKSKKFNKPIVVEIIKYLNFYPAEDYHQNFHNKQKLTYKTYYEGSGRKDFVESNLNK